MKHNKHDVILFHVFEKNKELDFDFDRRPMKFVDMETGAELRLNPADVRPAYTRRMKQWQEEVRLKCLQYKIDFVAAEINEGFEKVLTSFLVKRSRLY